MIPRNSKGPSPRGTVFGVKNPTNPDGFYVVCEISPKMFFWASWWATTSNRAEVTIRPQSRGWATGEIAAKQAAIDAIYAKTPRKESAVVVELDPEFARTIAAAIRKAQDPREPSPPSTPPPSYTYPWPSKDAADVDPDDEPREARTPPPRPASPPGPVFGWERLLGLRWPCTSADVRRAFRQAIDRLKLHPDQGGDPAEFAKYADAQRTGIARCGG